MATSGQNRGELLAELYRRTFDREPSGVTTLRADGSNREYYRLVGEPTVIGTYGPDPRENRAFVSFARSLGSLDLPVPEVYGFDPESGIYLQEDFGSRSLRDLLVEARSASDESMPEEAARIYRQVIDLLPRFQIGGGRVVDFSLAIPRPSFDARAIGWDLSYFTYLFARLTETPFDEDRLADDCARIIEAATTDEPVDFMYRDLQSRNIMIDESGSPRFIDFQGGRRGPLGYDLASLLYDAKANLPEEFREGMVERYLDRLAEERRVDREQFREGFPVFVLLRALQAMGAYGFRGIHQRKAGFVASIPYAVANVRRLLAADFPLELPEISGIFDVLADRYRLPEKGNEEAERSSSDNRLVVSITSFSYLRGGYPADASGHGGGHVFDCRWIENPGRQTEYRDLTGRDEPVRIFLENREEVGRFFEAILALVTPAIDRYVERGFASLSISFGCTGGQHRSVYMAERLAAKLREYDPDRVAVRLKHRELG